MDFLKGKGVPVATLDGDRRIIEMVVFADGSTGITCDGLMHSLWEATEVEDCFRAFLQKVSVGRHEREKLTVLGQKTELRQWEKNNPIQIILSRRLPLN